MVKLTIDGVAVEAAEGMTILAAAAQAGIEIPNLCHRHDLGAYGACGLCVVEVAGCPKLLRACATKVAEGMDVNTQGERAVRARKLAMELMMGDHDADCIGPCKLNCPAHTDVQKYVREIAEGRFADAVATVKETFPLPASIGRVCPHPCERHCRRRLVEQPISIARLKAFAADACRASGLASPAASPCPKTGRRVSVVGGGPAGLTAAYQLARRGHEVTVYDQMPEMGGMLRYGIPAYRLPKDVLGFETDAIAATGVRFVNNFKVGRDATLEGLRAECDALVVANGAWRSSPMRVKGEDLPGVIGGIDFLRERPAIGARVAVIGGGNTAMDACRTAVRLGADEVYVVYRRTRKEMPAEAIEIAEAEEEGVKFLFLRNPAEFTERDGRVGGVRLQVMELGEPDERGRRKPVPVEGAFEDLPVDTVIIAVGQKNDPAGFEALAATERGTIAAAEGTFATNLDGVFACGDAVNRGAGIAIEAIAQANAAAAAVERYLINNPQSSISNCQDESNGCLTHDLGIISEREVDERDYADREKLPRLAELVRPAAERRRDFDEVNLPITAEQAQAEAKRCLECGCHDYADCRLIRYAKAMKTDVKRLRGAFHPGFTETRLAVIERNQRKCIGCNLCVRVCEEKAKKGVLGLVGRGFTTVIRPEFRDPGMLEFCRTCRLCAETCPTGALKIVM